MNISTIIIVLLIAGIVGTILLEIKQKKNSIEYKSIFPDTYDEWTEKIYEVETMRNSKPKGRYGSSRNGRYRTEAITKTAHLKGMHIYQDGKKVASYDYDFDRSMDPYENPGMDAFVDETHHGMDRGLGIVNDHHNDVHTHDHSHPY